MRRSGIILFFIAILAAFIMPATVSANNEASEGEVSQELEILLDGKYFTYMGEFYSTKVNGELVVTETPSISYENRILVPLRAVFEKLDADVQWMQETQTAVVSLGTITVKVVLGAREAEVNGEVLPLDVPAVAASGRILLPVRFVSECLNYNVTWLPEEKTVAIDKCTLKQPEVKTGEGYYEIIINADKYNNYKFFSLSNPKRLVLDIPNADAPLSQQIIEIDCLDIERIRYALFVDPENGARAARTVIDLAGEREYEIVDNGEKLSIKVYKKADQEENEQGEGGQDESDQDEDSQNPSAQPNLLYNKTGDLSKISLINITLPGGTSAGGTPKYLARYEDNDCTYIIDFDGNLMDSMDFVLDPSDEMVTQVSSIYLNDIDTTRVSIRTETPLFYYISSRDSLGTGSGLSVIILVGKTPPDGSELEYTESITADKIILGTETEDTEELNILTGPVDFFDVEYLYNPSRVRIHIQYGFEVLPDSFSKIIEGKCFNMVEAVSGQDGCVSITIFMNDDYAVNVFERPSGIIVQARPSDYSNIVYRNAGGKYSLILKNTVLTQGYFELTPLFTESYDELSNTYTISFPSSRASVPLKPGRFDIYDRMLNYIEISEAEGITEIRFAAKNKCVFRVITRYLGDTPSGYFLDTIVNIVMPPPAEEKVVVIDPGHGGIDPGATYFNSTEKEFNLDIARRLVKLLKANGVSTYMTRTDDSYAGLYERTFFSKDIGSDLFLSIHNNAFNGQARGTMTIYRSQNSSGEGGLSNYDFAAAIQRHIVANTGTFDRGPVLDSVGLAVLRTNTSTAAALTEVVFIDNYQDFLLLCDPEFRQKVAAALCTAILESLQKLP